MNAKRTRVLIVGGGASGAIQALLLAQHGVESLVVEARTEPYESPRAHALNPRSLEICRALGLDMRRMQRQSAPTCEGGHVYFLPRLFGPVLGVLPYERQDAGALDFTPTPLINLPQTEFEEILFAAIAAKPQITLLRGHRWLSVRNEGDELVSTVAGNGGEHSVRSRYLLGCDGGSSSVREQLGIKMSGDQAVLACLSIVFRADLRARMADRPGVLYWSMDPQAKGAFIAYHMERLWSFTQHHPPGRIDLSQYSLERCREIVLEAAGGPIPDLEILHTTAWTMTSQVADRYGDGKIFLVGDAAHRFPPTGGLGLNTGIQDAHNLAWKIAAVESGRADASLLRTYETERRPVALRNADQSLLNTKRLQALDVLCCPETVWRDPPTFAAWLGEDGREEKISDAVRLQAEHFDSFSLQLGFSYPPAQPRIAPASDYRPCAEPGHRLPHGWLEAPRETSTLDLLSPTKFTLLLEASTAVPADCATDARLSVARLADHRPSKAWLDIVKLASGAALLVRPDGHIAWRGTPNLARAALDDYLSATRGK